MSLREVMCDTGEVALLRAVLIMAERDLHSKDKKIRMDAEYWFRKNDDRWAFSFASVCDYLGLKPNCIRKRLGLQ